MFHDPKIIRSAKGGDATSAAMEGVLKSAYFTSFQHRAMQGIIDSAQVKKEKPMKLLSKVKPAKTKRVIGVTGFPGAKM